MNVTIDTGVAPYSDAWAGFRGEEWKNAVNVRDFIQHNYTPYEGDELSSRRRRQQRRRCGRR